MAYSASMLLSFSVANFRSFRSEVTLNLVRATKHHRPDFGNLDVAPALAIFGANASGKSNLLRALGTMFEMIADSALRGGRGLPFSPFVLQDGDLGFTTFSASVRLDGVRYDYSFSYDAESIVNESLYSFPKNRARLLFERIHSGGEDQWSFGDSMTGPSQSVARATRRQSLLLSTAQLLNHEVLTPLQEQFARLVRAVDSANMIPMLQTTLEVLTHDDDLSKRVASLLKHADLGIAGLRIDRPEKNSDTYAQWQRVYEALMPEAPADEIEENIRRATLEPQLQHTRGEGSSVALPFAWESLGTRNFLALLGPILDRLRSGGVLVVDELDTSLHPRLVSEIVRLFQSSKTNPLQAQLIITTHDVTVMMNTGDYSALERDLIWFVEKKEDGSSELYALSDFSPRRDEVFSRSYLNGRYGALPNVDHGMFTSLWDRDADLK